MDIQLREISSITATLKQKTRTIALQEETISELTAKSKQLQEDNEYLLEELQNQREASLELLLQRDRVIAHLQQQLQNAYITPEQNNDLTAQFEAMVTAAEFQRQMHVQVHQESTVLLSDRKVLLSQQKRLDEQSESRSMSTTPYSLGKQSFEFLDPQNIQERTDFEALLQSVDNSVFPEMRSPIKGCIAQVFTIPFCGVQQNGSSQFLLFSAQTILQGRNFEALRDASSPISTYKSCLEAVLSLDFVRRRANVSDVLQEVAGLLQIGLQQIKSRPIVEEIKQLLEKNAANIVEEDKDPQNRGEALELLVRGECLSELSASVGLHLGRVFLTQIVCQGLKVVQKYSGKNVGFAKVAASFLSKSVQRTVEQKLQLGPKVIDDICQLGILIAQLDGFSNLCEAFLALLNEQGVQLTGFALPTFLARCVNKNNYDLILALTEAYCRAPQTNRGESAKLLQKLAQNARGERDLEHVCKIWIGAGLKAPEQAIFMAQTNLKYHGTVAGLQSYANSLQSVEEIDPICVLYRNVTKKAKRPEEFYGHACPTVLRGSTLDVSETILREVCARIPDELEFSVRCADMTTQCTQVLLETDAQLDTDSLTFIINLAYLGKKPLTKQTAAAVARLISWTLCTQVRQQWLPWLILDFLQLVGNILQPTPSLLYSCCLAHQDLIHLGGNPLEIQTIDQLCLLIFKACRRADTPKQIYQTALEDVAFSHLIARRDCPAELRAQVISWLEE